MPNESKGRPLLTLLAPSIPDLGLVGSVMATASKCGRTAHATKVTGKTIELTASASSPTLMAMSMRVIGSTTKPMDRASTFM